MVDLEYQVNVEREKGIEKVVPIQLDGVKQLRHYIAIRANERLDILPANITRAWRASEWKAINEKLYHVTNTSVPELSYQLMDTQTELEIQVKRHAMADTLKLRVDSSELHTLFSKEGDALNQVTLNVEVVEKGTMRVQLPTGSDLFGVQVNGTSVPVVSEGDVLRFNVAPSLDNSKFVTIQMVYSNAMSDSGSNHQVSLYAPKFDIPIEAIKWKVILPKGVSLKKVGGDFDKPVKVTNFSEFDTSEYIEMVEASRSLQVQRASGMMQQVHEFMKSGKQRDKANELLNQVFQNKAVGRDMNEDAHDLLVKSQWQHALMGLNTRRQKMYLENKAEGNSLAANTALEEAAGRNPLFSGRYDYNPNQVRDYMQGMDEEERSSLEEIARLLVSSDIYSVSAPQAMEVTLPEMGTLLEFERKIHLSQADGLELVLITGEADSQSSRSAWIVILLIAIASFFLFRKKSNKAS